MFECVSECVCTCTLARRAYGCHRRSHQTGCEPRLHSVHFHAPRLITRRVRGSSGVFGGAAAATSTFLVYDKMTENHLGLGEGVKCAAHHSHRHPTNPPLPQPLLRPEEEGKRRRRRKKNPSRPPAAAVQEVPGASPLMRPLKPPHSRLLPSPSTPPPLLPTTPSIDFSHSFSDKFELIIQRPAPGDVYFQHEGQLIHSITLLLLLLLLPLFLLNPPISQNSPSPPPPHSFLSSLPPLLLLPSPAVCLMSAASRSSRAPSFNSLCSPCDLWPRRDTPSVTPLLNWGPIYSAGSDGGGRLHALRPALPQG